MTIPAAPPTAERSAASARKRFLTSARVAPRALRSPISDVLSPTAIHIIVRIPIAPTRSEIAPIPATAALTTAKTRPNVSSISPCVMTVKSSSPPCRAARTRFTPATTVSGRRPGREGGVDLHHVGVVEDLLRRGDGDVDGVVERQADELADGRHDADDEEAVPAHLHAPADRVLSSEELRLQLRTEDGDGHRPFEVRLGEEAPVRTSNRQTSGPSAEAP